MKLFGSIKELVAVVFRLASGKEVRVTSAAQTGGEAGVTPVEIEIPDVGAGGSDVLVTEAASQALTNKTIDASANSISNLAEEDFETKLADANKALVRDAAGDVTSALITNANVDAAAAIAESKLDLDYPTSSLNSALDGKLDNFTSANDSRIVLTDGTSGDALKESAVVINGLGQMSGVARLDVDNVRVDGNTISSTDANGPITLEAAGTATVKGVGGDVILDATDDAVQIKAANVLVRDGAEIALYDESDVNALTLSVPAALTSSKSVAFPDLAGTVALTSGAQVITDKDIDGGTASDTSRITLPKAAKSALDALSRKEATLVYASDEDKVYVGDGSNWIPVGSDAAGSGELNVIDNPSAAVSIDGWVASGAGITVARTQTSSDLPLEGVVDTAIKITPVSGTDYVRYRWTMPASLKQRKLKLEWEQRSLSGYTSGDLKVEVYKNSASNYLGTYTEFSLSTDSSGTTSLASGTGKFQTTFDSDDADYYELRVVRVAGTTAFNIANVIVGPGQIQAVPAVGPWITVNAPPVWNDSPGGSPPPAILSKGTTTYDKLFWRRVGDSMEIRYHLVMTTAGDYGDGNNYIEIPEGLTADLTKIRPASGSFDFAASVLGKASIIYSSSSAVYQGHTFILNDGSGTRISAALTNTAFSGSAISGWDSALSFDIPQRISLLATIPIAEWAGAPNYAGQNDVEYVYSAGTWATGSTSSSDFRYGPSGAAMTGSASGAFTMRVGFLTDISPTDQIRIEFSENQSAWFPAIGAQLGGVACILTNDSTGSGAASSGVVWNRVSGTTNQVDVTFRRYLAIANDDAPASNWPASGAYWRVVKARAGAAVGFGHVAQNSSGLVKSAGQLLGTNTNDSAAAGYVGEYTKAACTSTTGTGTSANTYVDVSGMSVTLTAGDWDIGFDLALALGNTGVAGQVYAGVAIADSSNNIQSDSVAIVGAAIASSTNIFAFSVSRKIRVSISATTTYKVRVRGSSTTADAVRVVSASWTGALSEPDNQSILWARRVR